MMKQRAFLVAGVLISSVLLGCGSDDDPTDGTDQQIDGDVTEGGTTDDTAETDEAADVGGEAADDGGEAADVGGEANRMGEVTVDQTQTHPNGVELTIRAIRVEQNAIFLDVEAFNGSPSLIYLAVYDQIHFTDDTGRSYRFEPPVGNEGLEVEETGTLEGALAFIGRLAPDATTVTVQFNHSDDGDPLQPADAEHATLSDAPSFEFTDLPLPGA